jgi:hypothetical protein
MSDDDELILSVILVAIQQHINKTVTTIRLVSIDIETTLLQQLEYYTSDPNIYRQILSITDIIHIEMRNRQHRASAVVLIYALDHYYTIENKRHVSSKNGIYIDDYQISSKNAVYF